MISIKGMRWQLLIRLKVVHRLFVSRKTLPLFVFISGSVANPEFLGGGGANPWVWGKNLLLPPANEVWGKVIFLHLFVILFTGGGMHGCSGGGGGMNGCSWGVHAWLLQGDGGHAWLLWGEGGMHGCYGGVCVVALGGHVWLLEGGMHGCSRGACVVAPGGHAWLLLGEGMHGCSGGGMRGLPRDMEIRSMSGRYASYWNAVLFDKIFAENCMYLKGIGPRSADVVCFEQVVSTRRPRMVSVSIFHPASVCLFTKSLILLAWQQSDQWFEGT